MSIPETIAATFFLEESMEQSRCIELKHGTVQVYSAPAPGEARRNEDAALVIALDGAGVILAVADGAGGHRFGAEASQAALRALAQTLSDPAERERSSRERILDGFEAARREVRELGVGALTTLTVVQIAAGVISGSLALIADAIHNFSDALSLVIAFAADREIADQRVLLALTGDRGRAERHRRVGLGVEEVAGGEQPDAIAPRPPNAKATG